MSYHPSHQHQYQHQHHSSYNQQPHHSTANPGVMSDELSQGTTAFTTPNDGRSAGLQIDEHHHPFSQLHPPLLAPSPNGTAFTPSVSLALSSLSPTKQGASSPSSSSYHHQNQTTGASQHHHPHHHPSPSSSVCSSPPSYKVSSSLPPFYSHPTVRWSAPSRYLRSYPLLILRNRLGHLIGLGLLFLLGYLAGAHHSSDLSTHHSSPSSDSSTITRLVTPLSRRRIPFLVHLPPPPPPATTTTATTNSLLLSTIDRTHQLTRPNRNVPSILHYVFGMVPDFGGKPFGFIHYASIQSAVQILRPEKVMFHYVHRPTGWWFQRALEIEGFQPVQVRDLTEIYGRPIKHYAHKADIIRLEALRDYGGIYLDLDVFVVRNFDPLLDSDVVLGQEARPQPTFARRPGSDSVDEPVGLCNAVIIAKPFASFISRWLSSYRTFDHHRWADHSSVTPWALAQAHPDEVTVLGPRAFFYPLWHEDDLWLVHKTLDWDFDRSGQFVYHAWSSISYTTHLQSLDPDRIHASGGPDRGESSFTYFVRRFIHDPIREQWREAKMNRTLGL